MEYHLNQDYHIHSKLSLCSNCDEQLPRHILKYAEDNGFEQICLTNHFWDASVPDMSDWYRIQNYEHIAQDLPLPQSDRVTFKFGCETEMDKHFRIGIAREHFELFDFIIIPTTHLNMMGFTLDEEDDTLERRAQLYVRRFAKLLDMDLPENKIGIAHLACDLISPVWEGHIKVLDMIPDSTFIELFDGAREKKLGIELNVLIKLYSEEEFPHIMRPFVIAKERGCRFYFGSDAHNPEERVRAKADFAKIRDYLGLEESDRFVPSAFAK